MSRSRKHSRSQKSSSSSRSNKSRSRRSSLIPKPIKQFKTGDRLLERGVSITFYDINLDTACDGGMLTVDSPDSTNLRVEHAIFKPLGHPQLLAEYVSSLTFSEDPLPASLSFPAVIHVTLVGEMVHVTFKLKEAQSVVNARVIMKRIKRLKEKLQDSRGKSLPVTRGFLSSSFKEPYKVEKKKKKSRRHTRSKSNNFSHPMNQRKMRKSKSRGDMTRRSGSASSSPRRISFKKKRKQLLDAPVKSTSDVALNMKDPLPRFEKPTVLPREVADVMNLPCVQKDETLEPEDVLDTLEAMIREQDEKSKAILAQLASASTVSTNLPVPSAFCISGRKVLSFEFLEFKNWDIDDLFR